MSFLLEKKPQKKTSSSSLERDEVQRLKSENFYLKNLVYKLKEVAKEHNLDLKNYTNVDLENPNDQIFSLSERVYVLQVGKQINKLKKKFVSYLFFIHFETK